MSARLTIASWTPASAMQPADVVLDRAGANALGPILGGSALGLYLIDTTGQSLGR